MKVLVDTNVLMDVLAARDPFHRAAAGVWLMAEEGHVEAVVSAVSFTTIFYLARRQFDRARAVAAVVKVRDVFKVAAVDDDVINRAIASGMPDFEDAVQAFSGVKSAVTHVVTRDETGFAGGPLPVLSPEQLLQLLGRSTPT